MGNVQYRWELEGRSWPCECGGTVRVYMVDPDRRVYLKRVGVCDNPRCEESVVHHGTEKERRGRKLVLLG